MVVFITSRIEDNSSLLLNCVKCAVKSKLNLKFFEFFEYVNPTVYKIV